jgi:glycosyltransferase involved in cell wall biosynthesis
LCRELASAGHGSAWLASAADPPPGYPEVAALPVACINPTERLTGLPMPIPGPAGLRRLSQAVSDADAVIVHDALYVTSIAARLLAWRHGKPVILVQHIAAIPFKSALLRTIMRLANALVTKPMLRSAAWVVFISDTVREAFAGVRTIAPPLLLFNGVDTTVFSPGPPDRAQFGLPETGLTAAFVGRFVEKKGLAVIEALARARPDLTIAMAGSGPINPQVWNLPNVRILGALSQTDLARLYRSADVLLLPSVGEGYPLVIQEAMACGLPVACGEESARADPGARPFLRGVEIDPADCSTTAARLAAALERLPDSTQCAQMAAYAARSYSWPTMAARIAALIPPPDTPPR